MQRRIGICFSIRSLSAGFEIFILMLLLAFILFLKPVHAQTITIDQTIEHQTMRGWEVTARLWQFDKTADRYDGSWEPHIDKIMDTPTL